jgi:hypothetical protein
MDKTIREIIETMNEEQQRALYALLDQVMDDDVEHTGLDLDMELDEFLQHYGVVGMKWGIRRAVSNRKKHRKLTKENNKLEKKLAKADKKFYKEEKKIAKQQTKIAIKKAVTFNRRKLEKLQAAADKLDQDLLTAERPVRAIKARMERNQRMRAALDKKLDKIDAKMKQKVRDELLTLDKKADADKIDAMNREQARYEEKLSKYR